MFDFTLMKDSDKRLYIQIFEHIKEMIDRGELEKNQKLPAIRKVSNTLSVNPSTVVKAYELLEQRGYIYKIKGSGTYVSSKKTSDYNIESESNIVNRVKNKLKNRINFSDATPSSDLFPVQEFKESINYVLDRDGGDLFAYQNPKGYEALRIEIAKYLSKENINAKAENIQVVSGAQQAIDITGKMLINPGDVIVVEEPTYLAAVSIFKKYGAHVISFPIEEDGLNLDKLDSYLRREGKIRFIYTMINFHNPTGICWSESKKKRLLKMAEKYDFYIIEDDSMTELQFDKNKKQALKTYENFDITTAEERVIFIKSFSKIFMPGLRLAFMLLPNKLSKLAETLKYISDISGSGLNQRAFHYYLENDYLTKHINKIREILKFRHDFMKDKLTKIKKIEIINDVNGGMFFWVKLPEWMDADMLYERTSSEGLEILSGSLFRFRSDSRNYIRVSFAAASINEIESGLSILERCLENYLEYK